MEDSHAEEALDSLVAPNKDEEVSQCEIAVQNVVETIGTDDSTNAIPEKDVEANESKDVQICQKR